MILLVKNSLQSLWKSIVLVFENGDESFYESGSANLPSKSQQVIEENCVIFTEIGVF